MICRDAERPLAVKLRQSDSPLFDNVTSRTRRSRLSYSRITRPFFSRRHKALQMRVLLNSVAFTTHAVLTKPL